MSEASSAASEEWMPDSPELDFDTPSSVRATLGAAKSSPPDGPESPSTTTYVAYMPHRTLQKDGSVLEGFAERPVADAIHGPTGNKEPLICSVAGSPARTSPSPENEPDSPATAPASSSSSQESLTLFDLDGFSSRTFRVSSLHKAVGTSESSLERWPTSGTAWDGGFSTAVSSECRSAAGVCSSSEPALTEILQPPQDVPARYSLSARAAQGILRRAERRGRTLPTHLLSALSLVAASQADGASEPTKLREAS